mgnify:FL=1|tara:strand:- start:4872 stop:5585 length:714 start_codon:yes stop_codon:yes gene_type:complete
MKVLITGANSGLGKWLSKQFSECDEFVRGSNVKDFPKEKNWAPDGSGYAYKSYDLIIHCAGSVQHSNWSNVGLDLFKDNVFLTRDLISIPHKKFVYISSIDEAKDSPYGVTKRLSEIIVKELCDEYLILRPSGLLGKEMKKNTFQKIISGDDVAVTKNTIMNYILYEDILDAVNANQNGTKVLRSNGDITIEEVVNIFGKKIDFGDIHYEVEYVKTDINTNKTSEDNIKIYKEKYVD